jgi:hypothetical protein
MQTLLSDPCCLFGLLAMGAGTIAGLSIAGWRLVRRLAGRARGEASDGIR